MERQQNRPNFFSFHPTVHTVCLQSWIAVKNHYFYVNFLIAVAAPVQARTPILAPLSTTDHVPAHALLTRALRPANSVARVQQAQHLCTSAVNHFCTNSSQHPLIFRGNGFRMGRDLQKLRAARIDTYAADATRVKFVSKLSSLFLPNLFVFRLSSS